MIRQFLAQHALFTLDEFNTYMSSQGSVNAHTQTALLNYHLKKEHIIRIKRGLFATVTELFTPENMPLDPFIIASKLVPDAILAYHTALEMHGVAYSSHHTFTFLSEKKLKHFEFRGQFFRSVTPSKQLCNSKQMNFSCQQMKRHGMTITLTSLERTFVDVIDKPNLGGGWEEILSSLDMIATLNIQRLIEYTLLLGHSTIASKVGYFLEKYQRKLGVTESQLKQLEACASKHKIYLERSARESGKLISRWNLVVSDDVINRTWDELS